VSLQSQWLWSNREQAMTDSNFLVLGFGCISIPWGIPFWFNPNIQISTGVLKVDEPATISLTVTNTSQFQSAQLNYAEATVCALNTLHSFNKDSILPSLKISNPLSFGPAEVLIAPGESYKITLGPWTPTENDIAYFDTVKGAEFQELTNKRDLHACIFANCAGSFPQSNVLHDGYPIGNWADVINPNFCADKHHGQLATMLHRTFNHNVLAIPFYAGVAGGGQGGVGKVVLREPVFNPQADQGLVEMIGLAGLCSLPIQPALVPARVAGIARFRSIVDRIEQKAEKITDEALEALEHLRRNWAYEDDESDPGTPRNVVTLQLAPGELLPLLLKVAFDKDDPLGAVHVFDVVQINEDGTQGGFRLATINTPSG
jgi:hypothetical protein